MRYLLRLAHRESLELRTKRPYKSIPKFEGELESAPKITARWMRRAAARRAARERRIGALIKRLGRKRAAKCLATHSA